MEMNTPRTLILWGEQDGIFSIDGLPLIKEAFKNSQAMRFPDAAHLLMLEQPKKVVRVYGEFLREWLTRADGSPQDLSGSRGSVLQLIVLSPDLLPAVNKKHESLLYGSSISEDGGDQVKHHWRS